MLANIAWHAVVCVTTDTPTEMFGAAIKRWWRLEASCQCGWRDLHELRCTHQFTLPGTAYVAMYFAVDDFGNNRFVDEDT